jgi:hypothetical protein
MAAFPPGFALTWADPIADIEPRCIFRGVPTRYQQLRQAIANLAAPAAEQRSHLESIFPEYGSPLPHDFNADELGLEFEIYLATEDMLECGEISQKEIDAARPLDELLDRLSGKQGGNFWTVGALFDDARWDEVRRLAREALACYPDEIRASEFTKPD